MKHTLPSLSYDYNALEPYIDVETMHVHHDKHHQTYVDKLNAALENASAELQALPIEQLLSQLDTIPEALRAAVKNHGGGHANHSFFWQSMKPRGGGEPNGSLMEAINRDFGNLQTFKEQFSNAAKNFFGSGWTWLVANDQGALSILTTQNQDSPLSISLFPLLNLDLWEHAYYLKYQNRRAEYVDAWWSVVNWDWAQKNYTHKSV